MSNCQFPCDVVTHGRIGQPSELRKLRQEPAVGGRRRLRFTRLRNEDSATLADKKRKLDALSDAALRADATEAARAAAQRICDEYVVKRS